MQMRAALGSSIKAGTVTPQQIRQLSLQQQIFAQHRKLPQQKVTQIGQVSYIFVFFKLIRHLVPKVSFP